MKKEINTILFILLMITILFSSCKNEKKTATDPLTTKAYFYQNKAEEFLDIAVSDSAYFYYLQSNSDLINLKDSANIAYNYLKISEIHLFAGDAIAAEESITEALQYISNNDDEFLISTYNLLGRCYQKLYNYEKSIMHFNKALQLDSNELQQLIIRNNIANVYIQKEMYNEAVVILDSLVHTTILRQHPTHFARSLDNLGISKFYIQENNGLTELLSALSIRDSLQYEHGLVESFSNLSKYYMLKNQSIAKNYAFKMYELAQKLKNKDDELEALSLLLQASTSNELRPLSKRYITLSSSIAKTNQTAKNQFAKIKYDHQKEATENLELKAKTTKQALDIESEKNRRQLLIFILIILVVGIAWFIKNTRRRHREEKAKQIYITETKISKKIHDELANDIYNIVAFTENFDLSTDQHKNRLLNDLEKAYNKTRNISSEYAAINFGDDFLNFLKSLLQEYTGKQVKIVSVGIDSIDWNSLTEVKKIAIYRVIQELLVNMKKHSQANMVSFRFEREKRHLKISYSDNGTGIVNEKLISKNGLINAENRIKDIAGSFIFEIEINKGMKIFITIPL